MRILIVGANGFLGRNLVEECIKKNWEIQTVYHDKKDHLPSQIQSFHIGEIDNLDDSYDTIFLLSAFIPYGNLDSVDKELIGTNIKVPLKIIDKFKNSKIVFSSSISVYGTPESTITESSSFNNPTMYGLSKLSAEFIIKSHPNYQIVRFSSLYGIGMHPNTFLPKIILEAITNKKITLWGDGSRLQNYLSVKDAVGYLLAAAQESESGTYLGVDHKSYTNTEVAKMVQNFIPECQIEYVKEDKNPSFVYNNLLSRKILRFEPEFSLEAGIELMIKNEDE